MLMLQVPMNDFNALVVEKFKARHLPRHRFVLYTLQYRWKWSTATFRHRTPWLNFFFFTENFCLWLSELKNQFATLNFMLLMSFLLLNSMIWELQRTRSWKTASHLPQFEAKGNQFQAFSFFALVQHETLQDHFVISRTKFESPTKEFGSHMPCSYSFPF